ncbi:hypothetical protein [Pseudomonas mosselii]|uniref:hypothetical protein n=1 Tax=Pseudomonas mosselii TaxID=78327 RepID=UPI0011B3C72D|nr:hypothetical protein [Pseudomonas mosselii]
MNGTRMVAAMSESELWKVGGRRGFVPGRKISFWSLPAMGCLAAPVTQTGKHNPSPAIFINAKEG